MFRKKVQCSFVLLLIILVFCVTNQKSLAAPVSTWARVFGYEDFSNTTSAKGFSSVVPTSDGGYIAAGSIVSKITKTQNFYVTKTNGVGEIIWQKTYGDFVDVQGRSFNANANSIQPTTDGGYIVVGWAKSVGSLSGTFWVLKLDNVGDITWQKTYWPNFQQDDGAMSVKQTLDGGYIVVGYGPTSMAFLGDDLLVVKLDTLGNVEWGHGIGANANFIDAANDVWQTSDGGYIIAGETRSFGAGLSDGWLIKLNSSGSIEWQKTYGTTDWDSIMSVQQTSDNGYIVAGFSGNPYDGWIAKLDSSGLIVWQKKLTTSLGEGVTLYSVIITNDGGYVVVGTGGSAGLYGVVAKFDVNGSNLWAHFYGDSTAYLFLDTVKENTDGSLIVGGKVGGANITPHLPSIFGSEYQNETPVLIKLSSQGLDTQSLLPTQAISLNSIDDNFVAADSSGVITAPVIFKEDTSIVPNTPDMLSKSLSEMKIRANWLQSLWYGGPGQTLWGDSTKYDSQGGDGANSFYITPGGRATLTISASNVVGQENLSSNRDSILFNNPSMYSVNSPQSSIVVNGKIITADTSNNRVLITDITPINGFYPAETVIGQQDLASNIENQGLPVGANTLSHPSGVYSDGTKLFVADSGNNRVLIYNTIPVSNNASADVVVGQPNMTSGDANQGGTVAANTLNSQITICTFMCRTYWKGRVFVEGTKLYISDPGNNRVLIYNTVPISDDASADVVVGQPDMTSSDVNQGGATAANTLNVPVGIYSDGTKLFVADSYNSRVLIYNTIPVSNNASADVVVGQADMSGACSNQCGSVDANTLSYPEGIESNGAGIFIADTNNHRVLSYNTTPVADNTLADVVLGQGDFTSNSANGGKTTNDSSLFGPQNIFSYGIDPGGTILFVTDSGNNRILRFIVPTLMPGKGSVAADLVIGEQDMNTATGVFEWATEANVLNKPDSAFSVNGKLIISDTTNNRVLIYNTIPVSNNVSADVVIGQPDMTSSNANQGGAVGANTLSAPRGVYSDGTKLFVADSGNNRVLIYNTIPISDNASADVVVGQPDMTSGDTNQGGTANANTLNTPVGIYFGDTKFFIADSGNNRVLVYNTIPASDDTAANVVVGQPDMTSSGVNQGTGTDAFTLSGPSGVFSDGTKLFIGDTSNNRVLVYNTIPLSNNASANVVIGQRDFTQSTANEFYSDPAGETLSSPSGIYSDGTKLYIVDSGNNRVSVFTSVPTINNTSADYVIGQNAFNIATPGLDSAHFNNPTSVYSDGSKLYVTDSSNNRVLIYSGSHNGSLTSSIFNSGVPYTIWGPIKYSASFSSSNSNIGFEISADSGNTWQPVTDFSNQTFGPSQYLQYRAIFSNTDGFSTPLLDSVHISYLKNLVPTLATSPATSITRDSVILSGEITDTGGADTSDRGFEYGLDTSYGTTVSESNGPYGVSTYSLNATDLSCDKTYHYRAYATNVAGTGYGSDAEFTTESCIVASGGGGATTTIPPPVEPPVPPTSEPTPVPTPELGPTPPPSPKPTPAPTPAPEPVSNPTNETTSDSTSSPQAPSTTSETAPPETSNLFFTPVFERIGKVAGAMTTYTRIVTADPAVKLVANTAVVVPVAASLVVLAAATMGGISFLNYLFYLFILLSQLLGFRRKPKPWGTIYDSVTKRPLPFVRLEVLNEEGRKLQSTISDANGRYGFLISQQLQNVQLNAHVAKYDFPSKEEPSVIERKLYPNIYQGGMVNASSGAMNLDIPMDPRDKAIPSSVYLGITSIHLNNFLVSAANVLFVVGATFGLANAIVNPSVLSISIIVLIFLTYILRVTGFKLKPFGLTKDIETARTLPFGLITLHNQSGERTNFTVSDEHGRYFMLTPKGEYLMRVYTPSHIVPNRMKEIPVSTARGWISKEIKV